MLLADAGLVTRGEAPTAAVTCLNLGSSGGDNGPVRSVVEPHRENAYSEQTQSPDAEPHNCFQSVYHRNGSFL